ncbi:protein phosphatase 1A [Drosophila teissieri]|uniref:protein phosphatase 1A n=1 Tax=Drosophila teissieri TaxID=7243 RepID=UPI001CB9FB0B|nr:protein phosphatase 1A [Drosophila teissieri]
MPCPTFQFQIIDIRAQPRKFRVLDHKMGGFLEKPETEKQAQEGHGNGLRYCVSSMQGWRLEMEDSHAAVCHLKDPHAKWSYFAVFDGHAGNQISQHCAEHLLNTIMETDSFLRQKYEAGIREGFLQLDEDMRKQYQDKPGGSTAICVFVSPDKIYLANCGDSRAVISRNGTAAISTVDHKPFSPKEQERIQNAGGSVMIKRVNGILAVSRALGDYDFKNDISKSPVDQMVSPEPDITVCNRSDQDEFIVIACDGIWDVMTSSEVCEFISSRLLVTYDLPTIVNSILDICLHKGSRDNMTLLLLLLPGAPKVDMDAVKAERSLDQTIVQITREVIEKHEIHDFETLIRLMKRMAINIPNLPPGGGLYAKYYIIEQAFHEKFPDTPAEIYDYFSM